MRIKDISIENRPMERLENLGPSVLSDAELLAVILKTGNKKENVIDMSNRLISKYGFDKLSTCTLPELQEINGIGRSKACQILALFELNKRHSYSKTNGLPIKTAKDVFNYCSPKYSNLDREYFMILHLDSKNKVIKDEVISIGSLIGAIAHPREVFKSAIKESAHSIILVHNHPSGDSNPSEDDLEITERLIKSGEILGIKVLDHVIIWKEEYWSWNDHNLNA